MQETLNQIQECLEDTMKTQETQSQILQDLDKRIDSRFVSSKVRMK